MPRCMPRGSQFDTKRDTRSHPAKRPTATSKHASASASTPTASTRPTRQAALVARSAVTRQYNGNNKSTAKERRWKPPKTFRLFDLPQELIDKVYIESLREGNINLLCTSRSVYKRASHFIKKEGVYRTAISPVSGFIFHIIARPLWDNALREGESIEKVEARCQAGNDLANSIENIEIRASLFAQPGSALCGLPRDTTSHSHEVAASHLNPFLDSAYDPCFKADGQTITHGTCNVIFEGGISTDIGYVTYEVFGTLRRLTRFARVTVAVTDTPPPHTRCGSKQDPLSHQERIAAYNMVKKHLERRLGPAAVIDRDPELQKGLEFWPLSYQKSLGDEVPTSEKRMRDEDAYSTITDYISDSEEA